MNRQSFHASLFKAKEYLEQAQDALESDVSEDASAHVAIGDMIYDIDTMTGDAPAKEEEKP